jgi:hypothetical protein
MHMLPAQCAAMCINCAAGPLWQEYIAFLSCACFQLNGQHCVNCAAGPLWQEYIASL